MSFPCSDYSLQVCQVQHVAEFRLLVLVLPLPALRPVLHQHQRSGAGKRSSAFVVLGRMTAGSRAGLQAAVAVAALPVASSPKQLELPKVVRVACPFVCLPVLSSYRLQERYWNEEFQKLVRLCLSCYNCSCAHGICRQVEQDASTAEARYP